MLTKLVDHDGVLFHVQYHSPSVELGPIIESIQVLDGDYRPIGPNLVYLLDKMFMLINEGEGTKFLSLVADECNVP